MIRRAVWADLPQIKQLWMQAFHDSEAATDFYFENRMPVRELLTHLLIDREQDEVRGMLSMLPIRLIAGEQSYPARYFFAIATDECFRRMGISTALIEEAERLTLEEGGVASLLVPANAPLFDFYGKRGYETAFYYELHHVQAQELPPCPADAVMLPLDVQEIERLRDAAFAPGGLYAHWDEQALGFVIKAADAWEAPMLRFATPKGEGYAYGEWDGETLIIKELACLGLTPMEALAIIHQQMDAKRYALRLMQSDQPGANKVPYGMIHQLDQSISHLQGRMPYLGLGKD